MPDKELSVICEGCGQQVKATNACYHRGKKFCDDCCLDRRMRRPRKTHWQYLGSIKADYLRPAKEKP